MKLWKLYLRGNGKRIHEPPLAIAASAEEALLGARPPEAEYSYEAEEWQEISEYERVILEEQERAENIKDAQIRQFYEENVHGLRPTLAHIKRGDK
ncbi:MAG TPA: hypothetical protein VFB38_25790 [Chthonomonadaceae bacterium]|nr:hypothetical protein [Chthonomonadaceae bacterium]